MLIKLNVILGVGGLFGGYNRQANADKCTRAHAYGQSR